MAVHMLAVPFPVVTFSARLGPWMQHIGLEIPENLASPGEVERALRVTPHAIEKGGWF